jgi:plasmid stabilization system protein ParE
MLALQCAWLLRLRGYLRSVQPPPSWLLEESIRLSEILGVSPPRIVVLPTGSPLLVGGFKPTLVVPASLFERLDAQGWKGVLAHELVHLKRRDHWVGWLEMAAACLWWWNPVFWYARRRLRESAEYACDAWVVRLLPQARRSYADSLVTVVASLSRQPLPVASIAMAAHGRRIFERRLEMILREAVPHRMSRYATVGAVLTALLMLPGWASPTVSGGSPAPQRIAKLQDVTLGGQAVAADKPAVPAQTTAAKSPSPQRIAKLQNVNRGAKKVITGSIAPDKPAIPDQGDAAKSPPPQRLVELQNVNLGGKDYNISTSAPAQPSAPEQKEASDAPQFKELDLDQPINIEFENQELKNIVDYLVEYTSINFVLDSRVIGPVPAPKHHRKGPNGSKTPAATPTSPSDQHVTDGMVSYVKLEEVPLGEALKALLRQLNLEYRVIGPVIFISTPANLAKVDLQAPPIEPGGEAMAKKLNAGISIEFEEQKLMGILDYMHAYMEVDFRVDPKAKIPGTETPVDDCIETYIKLDDVPLWEALYWITLPLDLTYVVKGSTVWITTPDRVGQLPAAAPAKK